MEHEVMKDLLDRVARLERSLVLVIDPQNDFCSPKGAFHRGGDRSAPIQTMLPRLASFLTLVRSCGGRIAFTRHEYSAEDLSSEARQRDRLRFGSGGYPVPGSWGARFCRTVKPLAGEPVIVKHQYSAFSAPALRDLLRDSPAQTLILTGLLANVCVETTARDAEGRGYCVIVVEDCVASDDPDLQRATLKNVAGYFGWVCSSQQLAELWNRSTAPSRA